MVENLMSHRTTFSCVYPWYFRLGCKPHFTILCLDASLSVLNGSPFLGESVPPSKSFGLTPADQLLARFKEHTRPPPMRKERGAVEYTVITKVVCHEYHYS